MPISRAPHVRAILPPNMRKPLRDKVTDQGPVRHSEERDDDENNTHHDNQLRLPDYLVIQITHVHDNKESENKGQRGRAGLLK